MVTVDAAFRGASGRQPAFAHIIYMLFGTGIEVAIVGAAAGLTRQGHIEFADCGQADEGGSALVGEFAGRRSGVIKAADLAPVGEGRGFLLQDVLPGPEQSAGVVPGIVEHDFHLAVVDFVDELQEQPVGAGSLPGTGAIAC